MDQLLCIVIVSLSAVLKAVSFGRHLSAALLGMLDKLLVFSANCVILQGFLRVQMTSTRVLSVPSI